MEALENQHLYWHLGSQHGYYATTFGWLVGEVIRRVTGRSGDVPAREVADPLASTCGSASRRSRSTGSHSSSACSRLASASRPSPTPATIRCCSPCPSSSAPSPGWARPCSPARAAPSPIRTSELPGHAGCRGPVGQRGR
ncbi:MAG: serine hydrolase [Acidimicrobiales bacterium]|nr:serine hydrolase [Acidimicrobiales bacterium]